MIITELVEYRGKKIPVANLKPSSCIKVDVQCPECNEVRSVHYRSLVKAGHDVCQSCSMKEFKKTLPSGKKYGMLTVISEGSKTGYSLCQCECKNVKEIGNRNLLSGQKSCGCLREHNFDNTNRPKGENHGMWKGGVSSERERMMQTKEYKDWRNKIFERDGFKCIKCGSAEKTINAHHIEDFESSISKRIDVDNGSTLCDECHLEFHRKYGRKGVNKKQLDEFISSYNQKD